MTNKLNLLCKTLWSAPLKHTLESHRKSFYLISFLFSFSPPTDWILGPKPVEDDDLEEGRAEIEEERRLSISSKLMEKDQLKLEMEKDGLLPGFGCHRPSSPPPLRSAIASSYPGEKRISTHSVTFSCPMTPYVTSL